MKSNFAFLNTNFFTFSILCLLAINFMACKQGNETKFYNGYQLPDLKLPLVNNDSVAISDLQNKVILVEFWASWCKPCRIKHPELNKIREKYKDLQFRGGKDGFEIYYVSLDTSKDAWKKAMQKDSIDNWTYQVADLVGMPKSKVPTQFNFEQVPTAYLIDGNGIIIGVNLSEERLEYELSLRVL